MVFSQFTTMLDLIATDLDELGIPYVMLTGQTKDRGAVLNAFQSGTVPVFLLSLKAGGVGLTLTEADTVSYMTLVESGC
nr:C-terminal helicase domain-containing protein [Pseudovibrio sp. Tun.PSC04-5.I4]